MHFNIMPIFWFLYSSWDKVNNYQVLVTKK